MVFNQFRVDDRAGPRQFIAIAGAALGVAIVIGWLMKRPGRGFPNADDIYVETAQQRAPGLAE